MLQLTNSPLKVANMAEFYLTRLDQDYCRKVEREDEIARARKESQRKRLRRSQSNNIVGRAAFAVLDLFQRDEIAS